MFEQSAVPVALVDRDRICVAVNEAAVELHRLRRDEMVGSVSGRRILDPDPAIVERLWHQLLSTNELYAENVVSHRGGTPMRVRYAAHGTTIDGRWLALVLTLSARLTSDDIELIRTTDADSDRSADRMSTLTLREREVIRRLAMGGSTRRIAAEFYLSPATIRTHVRNAMVKVQAHTRAQLVAIALGEGLIRK